MAESKRRSEQNSVDQLPLIVRLKGINWPWLVTEKALDALKTYDVKEDDVWVNTYPKSGCVFAESKMNDKFVRTKCERNRIEYRRVNLAEHVEKRKLYLENRCTEIGTHWTAEIVKLILVDGHEHKIDRSRDSPPIEFDFSQPRLALKWGKRPAPQYKLVEAWEAPRVIMTHLPEEMMPSQIYQGKGKVVFVIRNPKDIVVSEWHFVQAWKFDSRYQDWNYFFQQFLMGETIHGSWFDHVLNFWSKHRYDKNFLFLKYENMKQDIKGAVIQIADFFGKYLSGDAISRVVEFCSLDSMKTRFEMNTSCGNTDATFSHFQTVTETAPWSGLVREGAGKRLGAPKMLRKGIIGDWKSKFTVAQNEAFDALYEEKIAGSGLQIQFE